MKQYVDCSTCITDCPRSDGSYGCTFCDRYTKVPVTNADHIRAMSDEELANLLCINGWRLWETSECLDWLRQPWEEAPHD